MILTCPDCSTKFKVNPQAIPASGRMVKCAKCGHKWHAMPEGAAEPEAFPDIDFEPTPAPPPPPPAKEKFEEPPLPSVPDFEEGPPPIKPTNFKAPQRTPQRKRSFLKLAWMLLILLVLAGSASIYVFREMIVLAYPPAQKIYHNLGIDAAIPGYGLEIIVRPNDITPVRGEDGRDDLVMRGQIRNPTDHSITVPHLKGELFDASGAVIHSWTFRPDIREMLPGEEASFIAHVDNPPPGAVRVDFITQTEEEAMQEKPAMGDGEMAAPQDGNQ